MVGLSFLRPLSPPKMSTSKAFCLAWIERRIWGKPIARWSEYTQAIALWQRRERKYATIEQFALWNNLKPREAKRQADDLRSKGVKLPHKENEEKYAPRIKERFNWVRFGRMLIKTRSPNMVRDAFSLSDEEFAKRIDKLGKRCAESGYTLPDMQWGDTPDWIRERLHFFLYPSRYTPEQRRTLGSKYRVKRPKGKKRYYYNGTGVYRPTKYDKRDTLSGRGCTLADLRSIFRSTM